MRSSRVMTEPDCQCQSHNSPGFDPSILRHSGILGAADEAVLNNVHKKIKIKTFKNDYLLSLQYCDEVCTLFRLEN
jgi:hypothetical protein